MKIVVSIIVPMYNEEKYIKSCLNSLVDQGYQEIEILVGDDGSTDNSQEIVLSEIKKHSQIIFKKFNHQGPGFIRNQLAKSAKGKILVFVDADMVVETDYIEKLIAPILNNSSKGTYTKNEYVHNKTNKWAVCWNWEYIHEKSLSRIPKNHPPNSKVFRSILKTEFEKVGGYDEVGYGEDWSLSEKLHYEATQAPGAVVYHYNPDSPKEVFSQASWLATRPYKFGQLGRSIGLLRASFPVSFFIAIFGAIRYTEPFYFIFKMVFDWGIFAGIIKYWKTHNYAA